MNWYYVVWTATGGDLVEALYVQAESFSEAVKRIEERETDMLGEINRIERVDGPPVEEEEL